MKRVLSVALCLVLIMSLGMQSFAISKVPITGISLNKSVALSKGQTYTLKITFSPINTTEKLLTFSTSNKNVASIDSKGIITAVAPGSAVITVASISNAKVAAKCNVKVTQAIDFSTPNTYTWWEQADKRDFYSDYSENPVVRYMDKKFNTTFKFQHPAAGTEQNAFSIMLATGDTTDIMDTVYSQISVDQLYADGIIIDIAKYLDYMPNLKAVLDSEPGYRKSAYNDNGQILRLPYFGTAAGDPWGGLVYRPDILKSVTEGHIAFPSGNLVPTTVKDWDYMLPLMKKYFEMKGKKDYAALIIPYNAQFGFSELMSGFGAYSAYSLKNGKVQYGQMTDGYYNYLMKLKEWYSKGYIYKDFASRVNDRFYVPNPALTYGGSAGIWYGLTSQLGDTMGFNVEAIPSPIDTEHGITSAPEFITINKYENYSGAAISKKTKDVGRLLATLDWLYSEEGSVTVSLGLNKEQAASDPIYQKAGLQDGYYISYTKNSVTWNKKAVTDPLIVKNFDCFFGNRLPGLRLSHLKTPNFSPLRAKLSQQWIKYSSEDIKMPLALVVPTEDNDKFSKNKTSIDEYVNTMSVKFVMGSVELNPTTWKQFKDQMVKYGVNDNVAIQQAAYERYQKR